VFAFGQNLAINATTAAMSSLAFGTNATTITGEATNSLSGGNAGAEWAPRAS
jgi:hypothetical protein